MGFRMPIEVRGLLWVTATASVLIFSLMRENMAFPNRMSFNLKTPLIWRGNKNRLKMLDQPCETVTESIAVCITGEKRVFNKKIWNSILRNVRLDSINPACVHHFVVLDRPLDVQTKPLGQNEYWMHMIATNQVAKNSKLLQVHEIQNDFVYKPEDSISSASELFADAYDKSGYVNVSFLDKGQINKYHQCANLVVAKEREQGWNYTYIFRIRPDALWYAPIQNYVTAEHIHNNSVIRSHADTAWFANRSAINIMTFRPNGPEVVLPWAMCRQQQTLGIYFNYLDNFFHQSARDSVRFASLCYRLYMMFGLPGNGQPPNDLGRFDFQKHIQAWFKSNKTSSEFTGVCSGLAPLLKSAPVVRHDVEMCSYWGSLPQRASAKIQEFDNWFPDLAKQIIVRDDKTQCQFLLTVSCEVLRALKFVLASVRNGPVLSKDSACASPNELAVKRYRLQPNPCKLLELVHNTTQQANGGSIECYHEVLHASGFAAICEGYVSFDYYYWANTASYGWHRGK